MKMMNKQSTYITVITLLAALLAADVAQGQIISKTGTSSAQFLMIPVGTRSAALGGAATATVNDASAMYWNPGALALVNRTQVSIEHSEWFADLRHNHLGVVLPMGGAGVLGLNVISLSMDDMEETTFEQQDGTGRMFGAYSYAVGVTYARYLMSNFTIGASVKFINETIWNSSSSSVAVDLGTTYVTPFDGIRFGVRIANFGPKMAITGPDLRTTVDIDPGSAGNNPQVGARLDTKGFDLPLMLQVGLAWDGYTSDMFRATIMADGISPSDANQSVNVGLELAFLEERVAVQAGLPELLLGDDRMYEFTVGGLVNYELNPGMGFSVGYAMLSHKFLGLTNRFSLKLSF
jgi:hypothetical protein